MSFGFGSQFRILCAWEQLHSEVHILKSHTRLRGFPSFHRSPRVFSFSPCPGCPVPRPGADLPAGSTGSGAVDGEETSRSTCPGRELLWAETLPEAAGPGSLGGVFVGALWSGSHRALDPAPCVLAEDSGTKLRCVLGFSLGADHELGGPSGIGISLCLHVSSGELQPGCCVRGTLASRCSSTWRRCLTHARSLGSREPCSTWGALWVTGSPAAHGELCSTRGSPQHRGSPVGHGEPCGSREPCSTRSPAGHGGAQHTGALQHTAASRGPALSLKISGSPDPLQPAEKWGNDAALIPINTALDGSTARHWALGHTGGVGREL